MYDLNTIEEKIVQWSYDRGILQNGKAVTQCLKLMSELGELADNLAKGKNCEDDIGDCFVVLTNIARLEGTTLTKCANIAYEDIKDRKGFLNANGNFIKSTDADYKQLFMEFEASNIVEEPKDSDELYVSGLALSHNLRLTPELMQKYSEPPLDKPLLFMDIEE